MIDIEKNQRFEEFENEYVQNQSEESDLVLGQGYYFIEVVNCLPREIFSDEYIKRNSPLITEITNQFYLKNEQTQDIPPHTAAQRLEIFFRALLLHGIR